MVPKGMTLFILPLIDVEFYSVNSKSSELLLLYGTVPVFKNDNIMPFLNFSSLKRQVDCGGESLTEKTAVLDDLTIGD
jgi:hypothetical protein